MSTLTIYLLMSTFFLALVASVWSTKSHLNIILKTAYVAVAVFGAIMSARALGAV